MENGSQADEESGTPAPRVRAETELRYELEGLISGLPAGALGMAGAPSTRAQAVWSAKQRDFLEYAAKVLNLHLQELLFAGFAALLLRLAGQDTVSISCIAPSSRAVTFRAGGRRSFSEMAQGAEASGISTEFAVSLAGASYQFLDKDTGAPRASSAALALAVRRHAAGLTVELASTSGIWDEGVLGRWLIYLRTILESVAENAKCPVKELPLQDEASTRAFYQVFNRTEADFPRDSCVHGLVTRQASLSPNSTAVLYGDNRISYRELEERSTRLAWLLTGMGAGPGRPVAVCMGRSADMPIALLAVLKAGSYYVPLDPKNPPQRLRTILEECRPVALLSSTDVASTLQPGSIPLLYVDKPLPEQGAVHALRAVHPETLAYIVYTSGSAGKPKGVMIAHRSLVNLLCAMRREPGFSASDRLLAVTTLAFDMAMPDMFLPLVSGGTLVLAERSADSDPERLAALLQRHDITWMQATPTTWRLLADSGWRGKCNLKMICGGETMPRELANRLLARGGELWNCYGASEATIWSGQIRVSRENGIVPVGGPIANTMFYVMDDAGRPLPEGVPGELYIGGAGVAQGYLNRPELTTQRFVPDPVAKQGRLFRTGDLVRIVNRRELEFLGRLDHQVKLRGYRIEPGEIEAVLRAHARVENAVVILRQDRPGDSRLVAYVTLKNGGAETADLRAHAAQLLPAYMLPQQILAIRTMPLTPSGKIDRRALPLPEILESGTLGVKPQGQLETDLLRIFRETLSDRSMGVTDNFFERGSYPLVATNLFAKVKRELRLDLPISVLFDAPTVRELARLVEEGKKLPIVVPIRRKGNSPPLFVVHSYLLYGWLQQAIGQGRPIYGLRRLSGQDRALTFEQRADLYAQAIGETCPQGALSIAGWRAAGPLTLEIGRRLAEQGRPIDTLALFDPGCPGYKAEAARRVSQPNSRREILEQIGDTLRYRWERLIQAIAGPHSASGAWLQRRLSFLIPEQILAGTSLPSGFYWRSYPGKIVVFRPIDPLEPPGADRTLGWAQIATEGVRVEFVPGTHDSMFRNPNLKVLGQKLREALQEGENSLSGKERPAAYSTKMA